MSCEAIDPCPPSIRCTLVVFQLAEQKYAVRSAEVTEIVPIAALQTPPAAPAILAGFLNLGGELIPVIRVRHLFGLPELPTELWTPLIILKNRDQRLAMLVDSVSCTLVVDDDAILPLPSQQLTNSGVIGLIRSDADSISLLSPQRLLLDQESLAIAQLQQLVQKRIDDLEGATQ